MASPEELSHSVQCHILSTAFIRHVLAVNMELCLSPCNIDAPKAEVQTLIQHVLTGCDEAVYQLTMCEVMQQSLSCPLKLTCIAADNADVLCTY